MKTLAHQLKQAFNALEFANVSQLNELNVRLNQTEKKPSARAECRAVPERDARNIAPSNSPCF